MQCFESFVGIPILAFLPDGADELCQVLVRRTAPQQGLYIMSCLRKETRHHFAVGCEPHTGAARTEWFCDGGNDSDVTLAVNELVIHGRRCALFPSNLAQRI